MIFGGLGISMFSMLAIYKALGNEIKSEIIYLAFSILFQAQTAIDISITGIRTTYLFLAATRRSNQALMIKEKLPNVIIKNQNRAVVVKDTTFSWQDFEGDEKSTENNLMEGNKFDYCLIGLNFKLKTGDLLVIVGPVGAGKSSLLMGLIGELTKVSGDYSLNGRTSYASDEP